MVPPFLAYYAADTDDETLLRESVRQIRLYREVLQAKTSASYKGAWQHIIGPESQDTGIWSSGNGWAAAGMTRVLATVMKAPVALKADWQKDAIEELTRYIKEILDGAIGSSRDDGLLRNYWQDLTGPHGFGEISGSSLLASVAYRMAVIDPKTFGKQYIAFAEDMRKALASHITAKGIATPSVNPLWWLDKKPFTTGSPEGQAFVVLMYAAYRDCITADVCQRPASEGSGSATRRANKRDVHARRRALHGDMHSN